MLNILALDKTGRRPTKIFYGWIVVACCCLLGTSASIMLTYGIYFKEFSVEFGWSRTLTSSVFSLTTGVYCCAAALVGATADKYGPRWIIWICGLFLGGGLYLCSLVQAPWQLFLFYGVIAAIGMGACYSLPAAVVQKWFVKKRGLALGISMCGIGLGTLVLGVLVGYLVSAYGWRTSFAVQGILFSLIFFVVGLFIVKDPKDIGLGPYGAGEAGMNNSVYHGPAREWSAKEVLTTRSFWLTYGVHFFPSLSFTIVSVHVVPYAEDMGISKLAAAGALSLIGGISVVGRLGMGIVCDKIGFKNGIIFSLGLCALMLLYLIGVKNVWMLYLFVVFYALGYGGKASALPGLVGDVFGIKSLGMAMGLIATAFGTSSVIGAPLGGWIFDQTNSYLLAFLFGALSYGLGVICAFLLRPGNQGDGSHG